ncbi:hypothetical protein P7C70_g4928, partial [Phenoliferia sp. Uapishka_3]
MTNFYRCGPSPSLALLRSMSAHPHRRFGPFAQNSSGSRQSGSGARRALEVVVDHDISVVSEANNNEPGSASVFELTLTLPHKQATMIREKSDEEMGDGKPKLSFQLAHAANPMSTSLFEPRTIAQPFTRSV